MPKPGDVLGGKYRIERLLGSGGMGVVYEVSHLVMTRSRFAIKWWLPVESNASDATRRFKREAKISGAIRHPNVVEVYDVNLDDGGAYLVMELLEGESLADRIARAGALPVSEACQIVDSALAGVAAAHG
ncbi:MAG TPA: protein kinase, partial [Polyangiales bacterium]|nr:protein kinase [Polyangiales bacterium]